MLILHNLLPNFLFVNFYFQEFTNMFCFCFLEFELDFQFKNNLLLDFCIYSNFLHCLFLKILFFLYTNLQTVFKFHCSFLKIAFILFNFVVLFMSSLYLTLSHELKMNCFLKFRSIYFVYFFLILDLKILFMISLYLILSRLFNYYLLQMKYFYQPFSEFL